MPLLLTVKAEKWAPIGSSSNSSCNIYLKQARQTRPSKYLLSSITKSILIKVASFYAEVSVKQGEYYYKY